MKSQQAILPQHDLPAAGATRAFSWESGDTRSWRTTLTVRFATAGLDVDAGRYLPGRYVAELSNSRTATTSDESAAEMIPFDLTVAQAVVSTPSLQALDRFSETAMTCLRRRYLAGDPKVRRYFAGRLPVKSLR